MSTCVCVKVGFELAVSPTPCRPWCQPEAQRRCASRGWGCRTPPHCPTRPCARGSGRGSGTGSASCMARIVSKGGRRVVSKELADGKRQGRPVQSEAGVRARQDAPVDSLVGGELVDCKLLEVHHHQQRLQGNCQHQLTAARMHAGNHSTCAESTCTTSRTSLPPRRCGPCPGQRAR